MSGITQRRKCEYDRAVSIFQDWRMVTVHLRCHRRAERRTVLDHLPPYAREFFRRDRSCCLEQARAIGPPLYRTDRAVAVGSDRRAIASGNFGSNWDSHGAS
jgi:hypothetical protein